jgi:AcrR family transcriptional regulator
MSEPSTMTADGAGNARRPRTVTAARTNRWGAATPTTDEDCRELILQAAARCFDATGPIRATVDDIARAASVHRTTVYKYFPNRNAVIAGVLIWEANDVIVGAEHILESPAPFVERVTEAFGHIIDGIHASNLLRRLFDPETADFVLRATSASDEFKELIARSLGRTVIAAADRGELRDDVDVDEVTDWIATVALMLVGESFADEPGRAVERMRRFALPGVSAPSRKGRKR